jgi:hypothetical protein
MNVLNERMNEIKEVLTKEIIEINEETNESELIKIINKCSGLNEENDNSLMSKLCKERVEIDEMEEGKTYILFTSERCFKRGEGGIKMNMGIYEEKMDGIIKLKEVISYENSNYDRDYGVEPLIKAEYKKKMITEEYDVIYKV